MHRSGVVASGGRTGCTEGALAKQRRHSGSGSPVQTATARQLSVILTVILRERAIAIDTLPTLTAPGKANL